MALPFCERLYNIRKLRGITQAELAQRIGVSNSTVGMYEQGRREPCLSMLKKICEVMDVTSDYLIGVVQEPESSVDIERALTQIGEQFELFNSITYRGKALSEQDKKKLLESMTLAARVVLSETQGK